MDDKEIRIPAGPCSAFLELMSEEDHCLLSERGKDWTSKLGRIQDIRGIPIFGHFTKNFDLFQNF